jgi:hypothetical protein
MANIATDKDVVKWDALTPRTTLSPIAETLTLLPMTPALTLAQDVDVGPCTAFARTAVFVVVARRRAVPELTIGFDARQTTHIAAEDRIVD